MSSVCVGASAHMERARQAPRVVKGTDNVRIKCPSIAELHPLNPAGFRPGTWRDLSDLVRSLKGPWRDQSDSAESPEDPGMDSPVGFRGDPGGS